MANPYVRVTAVHSRAVERATANIDSSVVSDVDTNFIDKGGSANSETSFGGELVDLGWIDAFLEESEDFFQSGSEASIAVEAGDVLDDNDSLLLLEANFASSSESFFGCLSSWNNFQKLHLWDGREVVHTL